MFSFSASEKSQTPVCKSSGLSAIKLTAQTIKIISQTNAKAENTNPKTPQTLTGLTDCITAQNKISPLTKTRPIYLCIGRVFDRKFHEESGADHRRGASAHHQPGGTDRSQKPAGSSDHTALYRKYHSEAGKWDHGYPCLNGCESASAQREAPPDLYIYQRCAGNEHEKYRAFAQCEKYLFCSKRAKKRERGTSVGQNKLCCTSRPKKFTN